MPTLSVHDLTPRALAAQLVVPVLDLRTSETNDPEKSWALAEFQVIELGVGGLILFGGEASEVRQRLAELQRSAAVPLLVGADLERGVAQQVLGGRAHPPLMALGATASPALVEQAGEDLAREALDLGINWILGPVADLADEPRNPIVGTRSLGADPGEVGELVAAYVRGIETTGALACAKHFPGHGATTEDSHDSQPVVTKAGGRLRQEDLHPFERALAAGASSFMTAHVSYPTLCDDARPATVNPQLVNGLLRGELGFEGLVVTDALIMDGVKGGGTEAEAAVAAIQAGCDLLLYPHDLAGVIDALATWAKTAEGLAALRVAAGRVLARKATLPPPSNATPSTGRDVGSKVAAAAITRLGAAQPPLKSGDAIAYVALDDDGLPGLGHELVASLVDAGVKLRPVALCSPVDDTARARLAAALEDEPRLVVAVGCRVRAWKGRPGLAPDLHALLVGLPAARLTVVGLCGPYPLRGAIPTGAELLLAYGDEPACQAAAAAVLLGAAAKGKLPVPAAGLLAP